MSSDALSPMSPSSVSLGHSLTPLLLHDAHRFFASRETEREEGKKEATGSYDKKEVSGERKERDKGRGKKKRKMKEKDKKEKLENIGYKKEVYYIFLRNCES
jgi:hypothetical protein